ncbi:hypothetical protein ILUMI_12574 [Ignelater luminosus]|uniref:Uncharacterized protein n=1 Tax=Ignelater luminosus TaxID=2038154 RepID=A0A8K0CW70_IGNLU|nr:hypothetical protein ILUMI_12574 [Ignelater luminosus]
MAVLKNTIFLVIVGCCFKASEAGRLPEDSSLNSEDVAPQAYNIDIPREEKSISSSNTKRGILDSLGEPNILQELQPTQSHKEWVDSLEGSFSELLKQFSGFAPYLAKLVKPIIKTVNLVMETGKNYVVEYVRNLSPDTVQKIQSNVLELVKKLVNMNLVRAIIRTELPVLYDRVLNTMANIGNEVLSQPPAEDYTDHS